MSLPCKNAPPWRLFIWIFKTLFGVCCLSPFGDLFHTLLSKFEDYNKKKTDCYVYLIWVVFLCCDRRRKHLLGQCLSDSQQCPLFFVAILTKFQCLRTSLDFEKSHFFNQIFKSKIFSKSFQVCAPITENLSNRRTHTEPKVTSTRRGNWSLNVYCR